MPEDRVTITADAGQYFDVLSRAGVASDRLAASGTRIGDSFLRGDRVVRTATANITQGLFMANNAADATLITMQSLERVFRIPIGLTIFAAAAIAGGQAIASMIEKAAKLNQEILKLSSFSKTGSADFLGTNEINSNLDEIRKKIEELSGTKITRSHSLLSTLLGTGGGGPTAGIIPALNAGDQEKINTLQEAAARDVLDLTSKQNDLNRVELERLQGKEEIADLDKLEIDHKERLGKLAQAVVTGGLAETEAARQLLSTENDRYNIAVKMLNNKQEQLKLQEKTAVTAGDFFADVGSGRFVQNFAAEQKREQDVQRGQQAIEEFRQAKAAGVDLGPVAEAELAQANRLAQGLKTGLPALVNADFSNLLRLSEYDFTGLLPLSGLTINIK